MDSGVSAYSPQLREELFGPGADPDQWPVTPVIPNEGTVFAERGAGNLDRKLEILWAEFQSRPIICWIHAALTVHIRRGINAEINAARFFRLWERHGDILLRELDSRWLVSACDTIIDISKDPAQRALALNGSMLVNTVKLYETERILIGQEASPYKISEESRTLFDGISKFGAGRGNMILHLQQRMLDVSSDGSLAASLVRELARRLARHDTVFRRFAAIHTNDKTRWAFLAKRVAVFNDTASSGHFGCVAVMSTLERLVHDSNASIVYRHPVGAGWQDDPAALAAIDDADIVIVNGEGSIHHNNARARQLAAIGPYCARRSKPAYLINTTLHENNAAVMADVAAFDHVWVRETASSRILADLGIAHGICPDLSMLSRFGPKPANRGRILLVDSVIPQVTARLGRLAAKRGQPLATMTSGAKRGAILGALPQAENNNPVGREDMVTVLAEAEDHLAFGQYMAGFNRIVTGRFHAVCFAVAMRIQFHAIPSNTPKIETLIADIGLNPARIAGLTGGLPRPLPFSEDELAAIGRYLADAEKAAQDMAGRIFA
ncbi:polysaccharide pyruvyl transferase family protein [Acuticoccus sp. MNP-M23]|uniref:polysaccharide pyruvyl transferase family protein n=1 Tax=Acuticoccus sp. MNP-M23 TaxID=3072793 RepID=UPI0028166F09|nr:polysaccharide pyruvyl transferase family protein [Acuticoccus sp. MNP-M23]WMS43219.1 polysaccharide pyruvyl transferase family protein [Acuticoccus sp. MNP-M23]